MPMKQNFSYSLSFRLPTSFFILLLILFAPPLWSDEFSPGLPELMCRSAILLDLETGALLYEKNADEVIPPASMTKLMSLHLAYRAVEEGKFSKTDLIPIGPEASFQNSPPRSSLMFLEEGQNVSLLDLMIGLALPSGNDAGIALAQAIKGDMESFVRAMNLEAERLGLMKTHFVDSFGYSENNRTTAREFARFCMIYLKSHPESLEELHALTQYTYPREENIPPGEKSTHGPITQYNHNNLVGRIEGVDGLKTGYIEESGYNIALTSERDGRRLLAVLMGGPGEDSREGSLNRALDATQLLTWGYTAYTTFVPGLPELPTARVWKGTETEVNLSTRQPPLLTLPRWEAPELRWEIQLDEVLTAPVLPGTRAGILTCFDIHNNILFTLELITYQEVPEGSAIRKIQDSIGLFFLRG